MMGARLYDGTLLRESVMQSTHIRVEQFKDVIQ